MTDINVLNFQEDFVKYKPAEDDFSEEYMRNFVSQYKVHSMELIYSMVTQI